MGSDLLDQGPGLVPFYIHFVIRWWLNSSGVISMFIRRGGKGSLYYQRGLTIPLTLYFYTVNEVKLFHRQLCFPHNDRDIKLSPTARSTETVGAPTVVLGA